MAFVSYVKYPNQIPSRGVHDKFALQQLLWKD